MDDEYDSNLSTELVAAIARIDDPALDGSNPHFKSRYTTLRACLEVTRSVLQEHNLTVLQMVRAGEAGAPDRLVTRVQHTNGSFVEDDGVPLMGAGNMQQLGSAITYARRYGLCSMLQLVGDPDDDGNMAVGGKTEAPAPPPARSAQPQKSPTKTAANELREWVLQQIDGFDQLVNVAELKRWADVNEDTLDRLPKDLKGELLRTYTAKKKELNNVG